MDPADEKRLIEALREHCLAFGMANAMRDLVDSIAADGPLLYIHDQRRATAALRQANLILDRIGW